MSAPRVGLYPGTFDPVHLGHLGVIRRATKLVDQLVVAVAGNAGKGPLFSLEERVALMEADIRNLGTQSDCEISVVPFDTLLMHFAQSISASVIIRGLRAVSDFEYEFQMIGMNRVLNDDIETVFLMADASHQAIASRLVKEIYRFGGDISHFVTPQVEVAVRQKFAASSS